MSKLFLVLPALVCFFTASSPLSAQDRVVVFGGYSYLRPPVTATESFVCTATVCNFLIPAPIKVTHTENLNGFELSATYRFLPFLGIAADFNGHYGTFSNTSAHVHQYTGLVGPEVSFPARVSPFAHVLFGGTHQTVTSGAVHGTTVPNVGYLGVVPNTIHSFASAFGAGIDLKLVPHIWIRPIQIDYLLTRLNSGTQNQPRISAGLVLHF
jgi:hypothetical protein